MNLTTLRKQVETYKVQHGPPAVILVATPLEDDLWSISGGFGRYPARCNDSELKMYEQDENIKTLVVVTVVE